MGETGKNKNREGEKRIIMRIESEIKTKNENGAKAAKGGRKPKLSDADAKIAETLRDHVVMIMDESGDPEWEAAASGKTWAQKSEMASGMMSTAKAASKLAAKLGDLSSSWPAVGSRAQRAIGKTTVANDSKLMAIIAEADGIRVRASSSGAASPKAASSEVIGYATVQKGYDGDVGAAVRDALGSESAASSATVEGPVGLGVPPLREKALFLGKSVWVHSPILPVYVIRGGDGKNGGKEKTPLDRAGEMGYNMGERR